jgi:ABC-type transporter Mla subunit MlaD
MGLGPDDQLGQENGPSIGGPNRREQARESAERWLGQLQDMIDQAGRQAAPLLRDVAAKAAELAAVAAENAGPVAHKAANVTEHVGDRLAARSKDLAADLRKAAEAARTQPVQNGEAGEAGAAPLNGESKPDDGDGV